MMKEEDGDMMKSSEVFVFAEGSGTYVNFEVILKIRINSGRWV